MKRLAALTLTALGTVASLVFAQTLESITLRTPGGDRPVASVRQQEHLLVAADDVATALGGTLSRDREGFRLKIGNADAALAADSRFAVVREDLIELTTLPVVIDNRLFVPWKFFDDFLRKSSGLEASLDGGANALVLRPVTPDTLNVSASVVDLGDLTKVVLQLSAPAEYTISREPTRYLLTFASPVRSTAADQAIESAHVSRVIIGGNTAEIHLRADNISGDPYRLENPPRIVLDLKKGVASITAPSTQPGGSLKPIDVPGIRTIVIDPGHGGKEVGAVGPNGLLEKDTTLAICKKLAALAEQKLGARVILTRYDDSIVPLDARTAIANRYKADLFLSVHLNAAVVRNAKGSETYFLSLEASDELARKAAEQENRFSGVSPAGGGGDLDMILWDLAQQDYIRESSRFAELIQEEMNRISNITNRGVKQAPFKVLVGATMPAALVEVGFISNPEEEAKLQDDAFQASVATTLLQAIGRYKNEYETRLGIAQPVAPAATTAQKVTPQAAVAAAPSPAATTKENQQ